MVDLEPLRRLLAQQYIVLTPNRRLAHRIRQGLLQELTAGTVQATPAVYALGEWLERLWLDWLAVTASPELVLSDAQELWLWQEVIREQAAGMSWLRPGAVAQQAAAAYRQLVLWQLDPDDPALRSELEAGPDSSAFLGWVDAFRRRLRSSGLLTSAERDQCVVRQLELQQLSLPQPVATVAFDDIAPLYRQLLRAAPGWQPLSLAGASATAALVAANDPDDEIRQACRWLRAQLEHAQLEETTAGGEATPVRPVALIVPDLTQRRARIERLLAEEWEPAALASRSRRAPWINVSAGMALLDSPLVASGLRLLKLWQDRLTRAEAIALAQCPFAGQAYGDPRGVAWVEAVCDLGTVDLSSAELRDCAQRVAQRYDGWPFADAMQAAQELHRRQRTDQGRATPPVWRERFELLLACWEWPARSLDSIEYQQHQHWYEALAEFAGLDVVAGEITLEQALTALRQLLQRKVFQPRIEDGAVHVLGLLETAGLQFSAAWICGMGAGQWPAPATPQPLLPRGLQRRMRMPHCDAARELSFSEHISSSLLASAGDLRISYARERDSVPQTVSPLFAHLDPVSAGPAGSEPVATDACQDDDAVRQAGLFDAPASARTGLLERWIEAGATQLEALAVGRAPAVTESERPRGGSALFRNQAQCPFSAFARHRLGAEALTEASVGPTALDRGQLMHRALEFLWRKLGRRAVLAALSPGQRHAQVAEAVGVALDEWQAARSWQNRDRLRQLEQERLEKLLEHWLETVELPRDEFTVVAVEQSRKARFGPLELQLRADRIDRLEDGRDLILDYKNGRAQPADWFGERPAEPQLPLYAVLAEADRPASVAGIAFAQLRAEGSQLRGLGDAGPVDMPATDWAACKRDWREVLQGLAEDFIDGRADVDPKQPPQTCRYCPLTSVCRFYHQASHQSEQLTVELAESADEDAGFEQRAGVGGEVAP